MALIDRFSLVALALASLCPSGNARAEPIAHEYVAPPSDEETPWPPAGQLPTQIRAGNEQLRRPDQPASSEPVLRPNQDNARTRGLSLNRRTTLDGRLNYVATFNPSLVPFKRVTAFDTVDTAFRLRVGYPALQPLRPSGAQPPPDHALFWGSTVLLARKGVPLPLPSVAAGATIAGYRITPAASATFLRDSADNHLVRLDRDGRFRLVFLTHAPQRYFSAEIPASASLAGIPEQLRPRVPENVAKAAQEVIDHIGVRGADLALILPRLVAYFRNFKAERLTRHTENIYLDVALSQRGVCRHRAFAFLVTAQALGIPCRYVENEAHAFVEVYVPHHGWARIDLGGAAVGLDVANAQTRALHQPGLDPFPRPERFHSAYSQLSGPLHGISQKNLQRARSRRRLFDWRSLRAERQSGAGAQGPIARAANAGATPGIGAPQTSSPSSSELPSDLATATHDQGQHVPTRLTLSRQPSRVRRGASIEVWGRIHAAGAIPSGLRVDIYLSRDRTLALLLGTTITDAHGIYRARVAIPFDMPVGDFRVYAATPGNRFFGRSLSP